MAIGFRDRSQKSGKRVCAFFNRRALAELAAIFDRCAIVSVGGLMCTVSFVPRTQGFYLAMNRDERRERFAALPPEIVELETHRAISPREPTGGTWISANDAGICLALINWHRATGEPKNGVVSRGEVVRTLAGESCVDQIADSIARLPLRKLRPFRLIGVVPSEKIVTEWRWNLQRLSRRDHPWQRQHWFSSGFDELRAEVERGKICASFVAGGGDPGKRKTSQRRGQTGVNAAGYSLSWLRQLHRSHMPKRGPFSICMHRSDATTVSYTEVAVSKQRATMRYKSGPCCSNGITVNRTISLAHFL
jgi:transport and Golgi organization protein 2